MTAAMKQGGSISGREAAFRSLLAALEKGIYAHESLAAMRAAGRLEPREAGLAREIALGTLRHWLTLARVVAAVAKVDRGRMTRRHQAIVYSAVYQVIWMDRVPLFAAVDEAVDLARRVISARAAPFVNAVLRAVCRSVRERCTAWQPNQSALIRVGWDRACAFCTPVLPDPAGDGRERYLAAATGERLERVRSLFETYGEEAETALWASQATPAIVVQRNALRVSASAFIESARKHFGDAAEVSGDAAWLQSAEGLAEWPLFASGGAYVQDGTALAAARAVGARAGERVLDLCAAPGGKSIAMALEMGDHGEIVACDLDPQRVEMIRDNTRRLALNCVHACAINADRSWPPEARGQYDAAIVDAPCSNTGVFARRPEARLRFDPARLRPLIDRQAALLRRAAQHVRPGGRLVYSTCSIEPRENERVVEAFLRTHRGWTAQDSRVVLPGWGAKLSDWRDGGFAARLARVE